MFSKITLMCSICRSKNYKVKKTQDERLVLKKFCQKCNKHTEHKEEK